MAQTAAPDAAANDAQLFWGFLFRPDKCGTDLLNRLLHGIAGYVAAHFAPPDDCADITPAQLAAFYRAVGGDYDVLFLDTPSSSVGFIYKSLGCLHSLQPAAGADGYTLPSIPALKPKGFVTWQTIQLLLGPEEHVPFMQNAVGRFDIVDPGTGQLFPKLLPKEAFPDKPDDDMVRWYESVSTRLRQEVELEADQEHMRPPPARPAYQPPPGQARDRADRFAPDMSADDCSADERTGAAAYFRNPLYRNRDGRPTIIRRYSRQDYKPRSPREFVQDRGRHVANTISRHFWTPWGRDRERRKSLTDRHGSSTFSEDAAAGDYDDDEDADVEPMPRHAHPHPASHLATPFPHKARSGLRRESSRSYQSATSSDSDEPIRMPTGPRSRPNHHVPLRHRHSHSPPPSPKEYFPPYGETPRRYSTQHGPQHGPQHAPVPNPHRHTGSDPTNRMKEPRDRDGQRLSDRERPAPRNGRPDRPGLREQRDHMSSPNAPPTPPPIKTFSGTNLSALAGGAHGSHHSHPNSPARYSPSGFKPTNEPLFATHVAHLQPPQFGPGSNGGHGPTSAPAPTPQISRTYYNTADPGRRPSYPQRGPGAGAEHLQMPARANSMRYSGSPRMGPVPDGVGWAGSRNSSVERGSLERDGSRSRRGGHRYVQSVGGGGAVPGFDGVGGRKYPVEGRY